MKFKYYATLPPGLEKISSDEIEELGGRIFRIKEGKGRIFFEGDFELIPKVNYLSRTIERTIILLKLEEFENITLDDIYKSVYEIDWTEWIREEQAFAIRPLRAGEHDFTSIDVGRVAGQAVIDAYKNAKGVRLKVNLDNPDVIIRVDVIFNELIIGIDTTGDEGLHRRGYRAYNHPAHLNASIASALVKLSNWKDDEILLDPMCGSGTILVEAAMIKRNIPPGKFRDDFAFIKIFGREALDEIKSQIVENKKMLKLYGVEKFKKHISGAVKNAENVGVVDTIKFIEGDATELEKIDYLKDGVDVVITNPPYGIRIGGKKMVRNLYNNFLNSLKKITHDDSRIIIITAEDKILRNAAINNNYKIKEEFRVMYGGLDTVVFVLKNE
ncbi:tRNA (guanine(6)-N2)-methyltransferase [Methanotorris igneus]|uniref:rRNA (Guanine-N(2)-)-methyltransferase n=1 Tax=Methanotorris igneus (strain DSM 5666 / JCM 11834 / Kol 5) TaxID=880724 RepID=F6BEU3_METIK|nr:tRNA (guanine(6)-N2)-methyltransferase [Methanotorris igneus]AEF95679.1 rRNA (guanine-N(2)-)-methyltransferase [Methanotorris igneus Kol 5]